jgi:CDP-paratose 2-epimerase
MPEATFGILEWFRPGEEARVERALDALDGYGIRHLRTGVSWADWMTPQGRPWYEWLMPKLAQRVDVLPCFSYTPPSLGESPGTNVPPKRLEDYGDFACYFIELFGDHFEWVELWNEPDNHREWNAAFDTGYEKFSRMIAHAAKWTKRLGKKNLLGGLANADPNFLSMLSDRGALADMDAVGVHGFPFSFEFYWEGWPRRVEKLRERLDWCGHTDVPIWITECGYSTWRFDPLKQARTFVDALSAPAERVYWYSLDDLDPRLPTVDGFHSDEREYHFGLRTPDGRNKLLGRLLRDGGASQVAPFLQTIKPVGPLQNGCVLVTGGCAERMREPVRILVDDGQAVVVLDNLSGDGATRRAAELAMSVRLEVADIQDEHRVRDLVAAASRVVHACLIDDAAHPRRTVETNVRGTLNVVEAAQEAGGRSVELYPPETSEAVSLASIRSAQQVLEAMQSS